MYRDHDYDGFTVEFSCDGEYSHGQWCGVSGDGAGYSYKITKKTDLAATYNSETITMTHNIQVTEYVGISKFSVPINTVKIKGFDKFNIEDWV